MLADLKLPVLQARGQHSRLKMFYKINRSQIPITPPATLQLKPLQRRGDNGYSYVHLRSRTDPLHSSFFPRTVRQWNNLSVDIVSSNSVAQFLTKIRHTT